jgi:ABC-type sulfate transport system permease component
LGGSLRLLKRLIVFLVALSVACFVVAVVTYESPSGWFSYTPLSEDPEVHGDHWPWLSAGAAFLVSAAAVAATSWVGRRRSGRETG